MKQTKIIAISSFTCHGNAGLKPMMTVLTNHLIPVPSIILTATTNIPGFIKTETDFRTLLKGSLELCKTLDFDVVLFCGYFYKADQIDYTLELYHKYRDIISLVLIDPILGDHDKLYVEKEIMTHIPGLLSIANIAFPNVKEVALLTNINNDLNRNLNDLLIVYPAITLIVKSVKKGRESIGIRILSNQMKFDYYHPYIDTNFGGTGDHFISYFIFHHIFKKQNIIKAVKIAAQNTVKTIKNTVKKGSKELITNL